MGKHLWSAIFETLSNPVKGIAAQGNAKDMWQLAKKRPRGAEKGKKSVKTRCFKQSQPNPHHGSVPLNILKKSWKDYEGPQKNGWLDHIRYVQELGSEWVASQNTTLCMRGLWTKRQMYPYLKITRTVLFQPLHIVRNDFILAHIYLSLSPHHV